MREETGWTKDRKRPKCKGHYDAHPHDFQHDESDVFVEFGFFRTKVLFIYKKAVFFISSFWVQYKQRKMYAFLMQSKYAERYVGKVIT